MADVVQTIRAFVQDHMLEPDALRGSEHVLRDLDINDEEQARRDAAKEAIVSGTPFRMTSGGTQTKALDTAPAAVDSAAYTQWAKDNGWSPPKDKAEVNKEYNVTEPPERKDHVATFEELTPAERTKQDAPDKTPYSADAKEVDSNRPAYASGNLTPNTPNPPAPHVTPMSTEESTHPTTPPSEVHNP